jgi:outer membrane receptor protein involved in Fe transport
MWQYVNANQLSPRVNLVYKPIDGTTFHAGYARYFTPPSQVIAAPTNIAATANTTAQPENFQQNPVLPERSHYFDVGVVQKITPNLQVGVDAYYKIARDLLDDGQFGQALILSGFNYERGYNSGVEVSATYKDGNFSAYGNIAWARQVAKNVVSNQYLFGNDELAYIANNYVYTDHAQTWTASLVPLTFGKAQSSAPAWSMAAVCAAGLPTLNTSRPTPRPTSASPATSLPMWEVHRAVRRRECL